jgi:hypothetical protein
MGASWAFASRARPSRLKERELIEPGPPTRAGRDDRLLQVCLPGGRLKRLPVHEFLRHEAQGQPINQFPVSEDGKTSNFGLWRQVGAIRSGS